MDRSNVIEHVKKLGKAARVLDVGGSVNGWSGEVVTHILDIQKPADPLRDGTTFFAGDANEPEVWADVERDVAQNGLFDFVICTHTLEDIVNPAFVCRMMSKFGAAGFVATPSKYVELVSHACTGMDHGLNYLGYIHHRWIMTVRNGAYTAFPKIGFIETDPFIRVACEKGGFRALHVALQELGVWWERDIELCVVNNNYMGPDRESVLQMFREGLFDDDVDAAVKRSVVAAAPVAT